MVATAPINNNNQSLIHVIIYIPSLDSVVVTEPSFGVASCWDLNNLVGTGGSPGSLENSSSSSFI